MNKFLIIFYILILITLSIISLLIFLNKKYNKSIKRKMLYCLISFIIVTISAILLEIPSIPNIISIIILLSSFIFLYLLYKETKSINKIQGNKEIPLIPYRLKDNLKTLSQSSNNYIYTSKNRLLCCEKSSFKLKFNGKLEHNILNNYHIKPNKDNYLSIDCICNKCKKEIELYNSVKEGYKVIFNTEEPEYKYDNLENFVCKKCTSNNFKVIVSYNYFDNPDEVKSILSLMKKMNKDDYTKTYTKIKLTVICNKCGKKHKNIIKHETI